jgi:hypothetical protein
MAANGLSARKTIKRQSQDCAGLLKNWRGNRGIAMAKRKIAARQLGDCAGLLRNYGVARYCIGLLKNCSMQSVDCASLLKNCGTAIGGLRQPLDKLRCHNWGIAAAS